jgi:mono/diheme cytochrome c family protein
MRLATLAFSGMFWASASALAQTGGDAVEGHLYAHHVCAECHAVDRGVLASPNPAAPPFQRIVNSLGRSDLSVLVWLHTPHETMPDIEVESEDLRDLFAYLDTLRDER